ncbi:MAG: ATP-dependent Clp protease proteolytic subunit, partial [Nocardioides sp.]
MTRPSIGGVRRPAALDRADPRYRYWGSQKPTQRVQNRATDVTIEQNIATMRIYQPIDDWGEWWGLSAEEFAVMLEQVPITVAEIHLHINSPGGIAFEAVAMLNQLRQHPAKTVAWVDGLAASAASVL